MSERQSSGLVKKGKFVKRLLELMSDGKARSLKEIWNAGNGEIGPSEDYVSVNLNKLVASGEVMLSNGEYSIKGTTQAVEERQAPNVIEQAPTVAPEQVKPAIEPKPIPAASSKRNKDMETFLACAFLQDVAGWQEAADYYCLTHSARYSIKKFDGKIAGERIIFE